MENKYYTPEAEEMCVGLELEYFRNEVWYEHEIWNPEEDRSKQYDEIMRYVSDLLHTAKVDTVDQLKGIPVEATFEGMTLKEWRILDEVL